MSSLVYGVASSNFSSAQLLAASDHDLAVGLSVSTSRMDGGYEKQEPTGRFGKKTTQQTTAKKVMFCLRILVVFMVIVVVMYISTCRYWDANRHCCNRGGE